MNIDKLQERVKMINIFLSPDSINLSKVNNGFQILCKKQTGDTIYQLSEKGLLGFLTGMEEIISML